jgi:serine/threonine protein kinase
MTNISDSSNSKNTDKDKSVQWIEEGISKRFINYIEYNEFQNIQRVGSGAFGKVYKANWKSSNTVVALKSFINDGCILKEIVNEVNNNNRRIFNEF